MRILKYSIHTLKKTQIFGTLFYTSYYCRGPVGVQGLLTYKWLLNSQASDGHIVADFSTNSSSSDGSGVPLLKYTHAILNDYDKWS